MVGLQKLFNPFLKTSKVFRSKRPPLKPAVAGGDSVCAASFAVKHYSGFEFFCSQSEFTPALVVDKPSRVGTTATTHRALRDPTCNKKGRLIIGLFSFLS